MYKPSRITPPPPKTRDKPRRILSEFYVINKTSAFKFITKFLQDKLDYFKDLTQ